MKARHSVFAVAAPIARVVVALAGITYGTNHNWPDYVHVSYGIPLTFAIHTLDTIAGPADSWTLELGSLVANLTFWLTGMAVILLTAAYLEGHLRHLGSPPSIPDSKAA